MLASTWNAHYASLRRSISTLKASQEFKALNPLLPRRFADAVALIEHLNKPTSDYFQTNAIYRVLVVTAQRGSSFATAVLWLGLWRGVDGIFRRWLRRVRNDRELASDIGIAFTEAIHAADLSRIEQPAATLVANTERRLTHARRREDKRVASQDEVPSDSSRAVPRKEVPAPSGLGMHLSLPGDDGAQRVDRWIRDRLPQRDAELIVATVIEGETQKEVADRLGVSAPAIRKRHQRAMKVLAGVSHFDDSQRVYRMRGSKPPPGRARR